MTDNRGFTTGPRRRWRRSGHLGVALTAVSGLLAMIVPTTPASGPVAAFPDGRDAVDVALEHLVATETRVVEPPSRSVSKPGALTAVEPELRVASTTTSVEGTVTHVYVQQSHAGIDVVGAGANVAVLDGAVVHAPRSLVESESFAGLDAVADIDEVGAVAAAADALGLTPTAPFTLIDSAGTPDAAGIVSDGGIARSTIPVRQVWAPVGKELRLAWEVVIDVAGSPEWWQITVAADSGDELDRFDYNVEHTIHPASTHPVSSTSHADVSDHASDLVSDDFSDDASGGAPTASLSSGSTGSTTNGSLVSDGSSYRVFPMGTESPLTGSRTVVTQPADDIASPFGWHDTNGVAGAESTLTVGNNVDAFTDRNGDDQPDAGSRPDGGTGLDFDFPFDETVDPATQSEAAVTQLFVSSNFAHDFLYRYGFDEAAGNFQTNNYGRGGTGGDAVLAEAQGLYPRNNANFATPPDGFAPRMQNYFWDGDSVDIDGVYDQGVVLHEYAHGLSTRLTGGRTTALCLDNVEQAGEGWSDYVALNATIQPGDQGSDPRGIGNYVTSQSADGRGIRAFPYSTDFGVDPRTYGDIANASEPHGVGSIWATMLWEMTWDLVDEYGLDADVVHGTGGNNLAMQLVVDGLKLQPCYPGFVDSRDAILQADANLTGGANACLIWNSFARRGLGASARQGSSDDHTDGIEAFDLPPFCPLGVSITADSAAASDGATVGFTVDIENNSLRDETDIVVTVPLASELTYVAGSATCAGAEVDRVVRMTVASLRVGEVTTCRFDVRAAAVPSSIVLDDDFDSGTGAWTSSRGSGLNVDPEVTSAWVLESAGGRSGSNAVFATGDHTSAPSDAQTADLHFTLDAPVLVPAGGRLSFWHEYGFEPTYDGGVVEISTDGGATWLDLGDDISTNGYTDEISGADRSPIAGRRAFTGSSDGFTQTVVDLCRFSGQSARFRFRSATDPSVVSDGWRLDEVTVSAAPSVAVVATATTTSNGQGSDPTCVGVAKKSAEPEPEPEPEPPTTTSTPPRLLFDGTARGVASAVRVGGPKN